MRIASNKISAIIAYYHQELSSLYPKEEIDSLIFLCFEQYLNFARVDLTLKKEESINESDLLKFSFAVKALKKGTPVQYVLGNAWFYGRSFKVNSYVLIPRQETEELIALITSTVAAVSAPLILDIGTGSGCIAVSLKAELPAAKVHALDISAEALEVARYNALQHKAEVQFLQMDILDAESYYKLPGFIDIIVSNPPYVTQSEKEQMHKNVLEHEPHLALFVENDDALLFYRMIADAAIIKLNAGGALFFEINEALGNAVAQLLLNKGFAGVEVLKDINGKDRMVKCTKVANIL